MTAHFQAFHISLPPLLLSSSSSHFTVWCPTASFSFSSTLSAMSSLSVRRHVGFIRIHCGATVSAITATAATTSAAAITVGSDTKYAGDGTEYTIKKSGYCVVVILAAVVVMMVFVIAVFRVLSAPSRLTSKPVMVLWQRSRLLLLLLLLFLLLLLLLFPPSLFPLRVTRFEIGRQQLRERGVDVGGGHQTMLIGSQSRGDFRSRLFQPIRNHHFQNRKSSLVACGRGGEGKEWVDERNFLRQIWQMGQTLILTL